MPDHPKPTPAQRRILAYAKQHPEMMQKDIAKAVGFHATTVSHTFRLYCPDRLKRGGGQTELQKRIVELKQNNDGMTQADIARKLGCSESCVSLVIQNYLGHCPRIRPKTYKKKVRESYVIRPCLRCGQDHKSTWIGDRICQTCKIRLDQVEMHEHKVYCGNNVSR